MTGFLRIMAGLQAIKDRDFSRVTFYGARNSCQCPKCDAVHEWGGDPPAACECGVVFHFSTRKEPPDGKSGA